MSEKEEKLICEHPAFAAVLSHAAQMAEHIVDESGDDPEVLEASTVTLGCDFVLDCFDLLLEYANRYEGEVFSDLHDELIVMYRHMAARKSGFGSKTRH